MNRLSITGHGVRFYMKPAGSGQVFMVASVCKEADASITSQEAYSLIAETLRHMDLEIVHERIFGSLSVRSSIMTSRSAALQTQGVSGVNPVTYIQGHPPWGEGLAGIIMLAVFVTESSGNVWTIKDRDVPCGRGWKRNGATFVALQNLYPDTAPGAEKRNNNALQARSMFEQADRLLREQELTYQHVIRTWIYLSDILDWYPDFNTVRNTLYTEYGLMPYCAVDPVMLPASTGIDGVTASGAACTMDLIAVQIPHGSGISISYLSNPLQMDAFRYDSAFTRGVQVQEPRQSSLHISGTAAIDRYGLSRFPGNVSAQINMTFDNIETLLHQAGGTSADICAATAFFKRPEDYGAFRQFMAVRKIEEIPCVCVSADICRDELLFEMDAEAVIVKQKPQV